MPSIYTFPTNELFTGLYDEWLILIAAGSVGAVVLLALLIRYIRRHCMQSAAAERYDANKEYRKRVSMEIGKNVFAFGLEIADYISDALSASAVFGLMGDDIVSPVFVILYLCIICVGGLANFFNCIARMKNFIDLVKELTGGVAMSAQSYSQNLDDGGEMTEDHGTNLREVAMLAEQGLDEDIKKLEDLTVKITEVRRSIRIEKFTFVLGFVEDLPITIMNSVLLLGYRDDIEYSTIYVSTLITLLEFGMKAMSMEKIMMLRSELKYLRQHVLLQRKSSCSKLSSNDDLMKNDDVSRQVSNFEVKKANVSKSNKIDPNVTHLSQELEKFNLPQD